MAKTTKKLEPVSVIAKVHPSRIYADHAAIPTSFRAWAPFIGKKVKVTIEVIDG